MSDHTTTGAGASEPRRPAPTPGQGFFDWIRRLGVSRGDAWVGGVCGGVAARLGIDPLIVRGIAVVVALLGGPAFLIYAIAWLLLPDENGSIHLQTLLGGVFEAATAGVIVFVLLSFLPLAQGVWWAAAWPFGSGYGWADTLGRVVWSAVVIGAIVWIAVWAIRRAGWDGRAWGASAWPGGAGAGADAGAGAGVPSGSADGAATGPVSAQARTMASTLLDKDRSGAGTAASPAPTDAAAGVASGAPLGAPFGAYPGAPVGAPLGAPPVAPTRPGAGAAPAAVEEWRARQEEWRLRYDEWKSRQADATRASRAQRSAEAAARSAEAIERARQNRLANPRTSGSFVAIALGLALMAGAVAAAFGWSMPSIHAWGPSFGLAAATVVVGLSMVVAGAMKRRSGFLAFVAIVLTVATALSLTGTSYLGYGATLLNSY